MEKSHKETGVVPAFLTAGRIGPRPSRSGGGEPKPHHSP